MVIQVIATRLIVLGTQLILAINLTEEDFGKIGIAQAVAAVVGTLVAFNLESALIARKKDLPALAQTAFWMSFALGMMGCLAVLLSAWMGKQIDGNSELLWLILILAFSFPIRAIVAVPNAIIASQLKFQSIAVVGTACIVLTSVLSIVFSLMQFGAASQIWPVPIVAIINVLVLSYLARFIPKFPPTWVRWRELIGDASKFWGIQVIWSLFGQIDYIVLAFLLASSEVGEYYFAYMLATQAVRVATGNLYFVMFPSLSSMGQDAERQAKATFRVCQVIPLALIPACLAQAFLSEPLLDWMYPNKWKFASELIMILSLGLAVYPVSMVAEALMHAQSRFREYYRFMLLSIAIFVCFVAIGALYSGLIGAAFGVSIHYFLISPIIVAIALRGYYSWHSTMKEIYLKPVIIGISVFAFCIGLRHYMVIAGSPNFNSSIVVGLLAPLLFVVTAYTLLPSRIHGLIDVLRGKMVGQAA